MALNRVRVVWTGTPVAGGGLSTFYFNEGDGSAAQQVAAVATFLDSTEDRRTTGLSWATESDVATIDIADGTLIALTSVTPESGTGTATGDRLGPINQVLIRLFTDTVIGGRLLRGRLFMPGAVEAMNTATGFVDPAATADYEAAGAALIANTDVTWQVWSRAHAAQASITTVDAWGEWAVMRSRRD